MVSQTPARPPKPLFSNVSPAVASPCVSLCRLDEQKVCLGCFRHVEDIREWRSATTTGVGRFALTPIGVGPPSTLSKPLASAGSGCVFVALC